MSLPKYPEYRSSGVEWLGNVPTHWRIDRFKASIESCRNGIWGGEPNGNGDDIACVRVADFDRSRLVVKGKIPTLRNVSEKERVGRILEKGNLLLEKSGGGELQPVGQVVMYQCTVPAVCSNFVAKMTLASGMFPSYWNYVHSAAYSVRVNVGAINQTSGIQNLDQDRYFNEQAPFPPTIEQAAIAAFLDRETAKIDALIAEQEKLIALLAEKRQATISHAVTRGLNPDAPMKDSGLVWLGEVPAHWKISRLKYATSMIVDCPHETPVYDEEGPYKVVRTADLTEGELHTDKMYAVSELEYRNRIRRQFLKKDDIVYGREGERWGLAAQIPRDDEFCLGQRMMQFRTSDAMHAGYLMWQLNSLSTYRQGQLDTVGATSPHVNVGTIRNYVLAEPPFEEQRAIFAFLETETMRLDDLDGEAGRIIALLKERRSALIAAAVTGQIDVRGTVPEETELPA
ncbi:restriction endonuclease subunit S [Dyella solisilvae]|uniref:Restriction endonuclease subunit S n=1 Tax=Dyella solisilvae TaxID=1920168 RepID=A0A370K8G2_9GAMM|nr:restriction endonuclease subunit S [Dyella solisilvae]RDI98923.1 restriction endonuclease subunit S [Dyella solisilvae]